jgi:Zn-dependent alcohol dehydrogenase/acyl carrier protein
VLIHAASGGVGLAAIQLAQLAGASVYGTAGSPAKREFLQGLGLAQVMNSRNLSFSEETLAATGGRGVDLVLNSLSGDFIPKSLAALAPEGRFLEIGKVGIWDAAQVAKARPNAAYHTIALDDLSARQPELIGAMLAELLPHFEAGRLRPLTKTVYPVGDAVSAFRLMAQTRHIGKVVITQPPREGATAVNQVRPDATYAITGGLGSLGMLVAERLVSLGARNLLLVGVTQPSDAAAAKISELERRGARVVVQMADVSSAVEAERALGRIDAEGMPALRGIVHAAGVLDDGMIVQQEWPRFEKVLRPKAVGAWNLHCLTEGRALDFFVLFSSVASALGSPGQSNYAAANAFLDGLAARRAALSLPGLSINWGPWAIGMAAAGDDRDRKRRAASGLAAIEPDKGLDALTRLVLGGANGQVMLAPVLWPALRKQMAAGEEPAFLKPLLDAAAPVTQQPGAEAAADNGKPPLVLKLETAAPRDRLPLLTEFIRERALKVLALEPGYPLDTRTPMNELGFDSLMAVELKNALDAGVGRKLPATLVFEHPTIDGIARHLLENVLALPDSATPSSSRAENKAEDAKPVAPVAVSEATIAKMSEEEAEAALLRKLLELDE